MAAASVFRPGAIALITGGASGIGLAIAELCLHHGMRVAIVDVNGGALAHVAEALNKQFANGQDLVRTYEMDVGDEAGWAALRPQMLDQSGGWGGVDLLVLNAGVAKKGGGWEDPSWWRETMHTNLFGITNGIAAFLPVVQSRPGPTAIVITGSKQGITNPPGNAAYNASKAALRSVAESLSLSLYHAAESHTPSSSHTPTPSPSHASVPAIHLLVPGWTFTPITGSTANAIKPDGAWTPAQVAEYLHAAMGRGEFYVICPDNDTSEAVDRRRMRWGNEDMVERRPPLTRWRGPDWKREADEWMGAERAVGR